MTTIGGRSRSRTRLQAGVAAGAACQRVERVEFLAFERARDEGATHSELSTDSRTGALDLYRKVGMEVTQTWTHLVIDLPRPESGF